MTPPEEPALQEEPMSPMSLPRTYRPTGSWHIYTILLLLICLGFAIGIPWAAFSTPNPPVIHIFALVMALCGLLLGLWSTMLFSRVWLWVLPDGLLYRGMGTTLYAPWTHIVSIGTTVYGTYSVEGLLLKRPSPKERQAFEQHMARGEPFTNRVVFSAHPWLHAGQKLMPFLLLFSIFEYGQPSFTLKLEDYARGIPVSVFADNWQQHELGQIIRHYAPQAWEEPPPPLTGRKKRRRRSLDTAQS